MRRFPVHTTECSACKTQPSHTCNMVPTLQNLYNQKNTNAWPFTTSVAICECIKKENHWSKCIKIQTQQSEQPLYTSMLSHINFTAVLNKGSGSLHKNIKKQSSDVDWLNRFLSSTLQYLNMILTFGWCLWSDSDCRFSSFAVQIMRNLIMEMTPSEKQWPWLYLIKRPKSLGKHCRLFIAKQEGESKLKQIMLEDKDRRHYNDDDPMMN